ncbi:hypothetical protein Belba_2140 [Belliella baltica DSM 15883]|uniref:Uncharacterized protein n=1 Tax=Belliella baltica (strain DSM 15883 / CIP 108006 / LMG 21964 / BA134) TaxID=866536 RepID=I3Z639_BELBD|nr:hypothetical protein [Belliella baltica]AFL84707.1 hypothetical protein Belba_2140 [Belliella baltica DSM 15883]
MAKKISRVTKESKLDKRTTSGRAAAGKDATNKNISKKMLKGK